MPISGRQSTPFWSCLGRISLGWSYNNKEECYTTIYIFFFLPFFLSFGTLLFSSFFFFLDTCFLFFISSFSTLYFSSFFLNTFLFFLLSQHLFIFFVLPPYFFYVYLLAKQFIFFFLIFQHVTFFLLSSSIFFLLSFFSALFLSFFLCSQPFDSSAKEGSAVPFPRQQHLSLQRRWFLSILSREDAKVPPFLFPCRPPNQIPIIDVWRKTKSNALRHVNQETIRLDFFFPDQPLT